MIEIWGRANSFNVRKLLWACDEMSVPYKRIDAGMEFGVVHTPEYLAMNPNGLIPVLRDGDLALWESNVCVRYLAAKHGMGGLCPEPLDQRANTERWMDWQLTTLWPSIIPAFIQLVRTPAEKRQPDVVEASYQATCKSLAILDGALARTGAYCAGDQLTMGDIALGCAAQRWYVLPWDQQRDVFPSVDAWMTRLRARAAFREHVDHPV